MRKNKMADHDGAEEILNLSSPPKPTRMIQIEVSTTPQLREFAQNTSSLPALAGEVAIAQKNQVLRLEKRLEFLEKLQVEYHEALRLRSLAEQHTQAVVRKSNLLQDDIETCQKNCETLRKELHILVSDTEEIKGDITSQENDLASEKRSCKAYEEKMLKYKDLAEAAESSDEVNVNITNNMKYYETLNKEKQSLEENNEISRLLSGEKKEIALAEISSLEESISELKENLDRKLQAKDEKEKQAKLRKEVDLLQKKSMAQLTWTRKQLQETMARNKQWNEEISQKEREIQEKRKKIEE